MSRISDRFRKQIDIDTPFLGVFPDLASAKEALRQAIHYSNNGWINLSAPAYDLHFMPPFRALAVSRLDPDDVELYAITREKDGPRDPNKKFGLPKIWLDRLKQLRQIQIVDTRRVDDGTVDAFWAYQCTVASPDLQGGVTTITKSREMDLRAGAPDLLKAAGQEQKAAAVQAARQNGPQSCESKAQNRAVAEALLVARGMTEGEFYRPWITVALVPHVQVQLLSQDAIDAAGLAIIGGTSALYGRRPALAAPPPPPAQTAGALPPHEPRPPSDEPPPSSRTSPHQSAPSEASPPASEAPPTRSPAATSAPAPRTEGGAVMASEEQMKVLTTHWNRLGAQEFQRRAAEALGGPMPSGKQMTATQASVLVELFGRDTPANPFA